MKLYTSFVCKCKALRKFSPANLSPFTVFTLLVSGVQLYDCRKNFANEKEREKWKRLHHRFMTNESDADEEAVAQHKLTWRSESNCCALV